MEKYILLCFLFPFLFLISCEDKNTAPKISVTSKLEDTITYTIESSVPLSMEAIESLTGTSRHNILKIWKAKAHKQFTYVRTLSYVQSGELRGPCMEHLWVSKDGAIIITYIRCGEHEKMPWFFAEKTWKDDVRQAQDVPSISISSIFINGISATYKILCESCDDEYKQHYLQPYNETK